MFHLCMIYSKTRVLVCLVLLIIIHANLQSQKIGKTYLPKACSDTPDWFKVFYHENFENAINVFDLDKKVEEHNKALK